MKKESKSIRSIAFLFSLIFTLTMSALPQDSNQKKPSPAGTREEAYRANNLGVALLEQFKYSDAAAQFRRALQIDPKLSLARANLAIALFNAPDLESALKEAKAASEALPDAPQPYFILGLIARNQNHTEEAIAAFKRVIEIDSHDVAANVNLAQLYMQERKYDLALPLLRTAIAAEPYSVTALYNLAGALIRSGQREEGQAEMQKFQKLRESGYGTVLGQNYLEQGRYAEAISSTGREPDLVDLSVPEVKFTDATSTLLPGVKTEASAGATASAFGRSFKPADLKNGAQSEIAASLGGNLTLFDFDGDGDLDLFETGSSGQKLYRNDGGKYVDVTEGSGLAKTAEGVIGITAVAGDYDNDTKPDLFVLRYGGSALYHNDGNGKFTDVTKAAAIPTYSYLSQSVAFVDVDHDGDLDIFIAGLADLSKAPASADARPLTFPTDFAGAPNQLLRNNGDGKFTDIARDAKVVGVSGHAVAVVPTDYDNRRDVDLVVVNYGAQPELFSNLRDGSFRDVAGDVGLGVKGSFTCAAAGDVNKDDYTDFFFGRADGTGLFALSDGKGRFVTTPAPSGSEGVTAAQFLDYDDDGLLDLVMLSGSGARVFRNLGDKWSDLIGQAVAGDLFATSSQTQVSTRAFVSGDIDLDGDTDLIAQTASGGIKIARNDGGNRNHFIRVNLAGKVSNRSGTGSKVEVRAGSLKQKLETYSASPAPAPADVIFGLGKRASADAVRVIWPAGIVQAETELATAATNKTPTAADTLIVTEIDRKPSSCPYLYTWNGERFEFLTDFMGGGEMGYLESPGKRNHIDPDEYTRITGEQLKPRDGRYEIRVTNELEETLFADQLQLIVVSHPSNTEIYPNEGLIDPPRPPHRVYTTRGAHLPLSARDDTGQDVLERISKLDRQYPDNFKLLRIRGYSEEHALTLDLGKPSKGQTLLLLTGWTDYAFSSDNVAAHQSGLSMMPPVVQVKDAKGEWQTVIPDMGFPVGRPQTVAVDLTGKFLTDNREVRIVTSMRIYWDQILVDTSAGNSQTRVARLDPVTASLKWRGFSAEVTPDGREPFGYDYDRVEPTSPWKVMPGRYTREGDVRELLLKTDDMFVISRPGDEMSLSFDATKLPPLPRGWKRTFLLYSNGFSKEMDINSASPDQVAPLPFHGMSSYPYPATEAYPLTRERLNYLERYNTRIVGSTIPPIETTFAEQLNLSGAAKGNSRKKGSR